ncbi:hypothetical protein E3N88_37570 [Mikania micrantha]|uniref:Uncharacterized protein n=1 Tax=Mikania micrantha TaxID=192012 RepID=A0A5N6LRJ8_9ASTR|nr:hypothetical protein E3N88_37570 [Mikania micrantha]
MMEGAEEELERRSKFLNSLIQKKKAADDDQKQKQVIMKMMNIDHDIRLRASDMAIGMQKNAFKCFTDHLHSNQNGNHNNAHQSNAENGFEVDSDKLLDVVEFVAGTIDVPLVNYEQKPTKSTLNKMNHQLKVEENDSFHMSINQDKVKATSQRRVVGVEGKQVTVMAEKTSALVTPGSVSELKEPQLPTRRRSTRPRKKPKFLKDYYIGRTSNKATLERVKMPKRIKNKSDRAVRAEIDSFEKNGV